MTSQSSEGSILLAGGGLGALANSAIGNVGFVSGVGAGAIGAIPMIGAGVVVGSAINGGITALSQKDPVAIGAVGLGMVGGATTYCTIGGVGLAGGFGAVGLGMTAMTAIGGVVGLAGYGVAKMIDRGSRESYAQVFSRMEDKIAWQEAYIEALLELDVEIFRREEFLKREFVLLEAQDEAESIKQEIERQKAFKLNSSLYNFDDSESLDVDSTECFWLKIHELTHHKSTVNSIVITPDGKSIVSGGHDRKINNWDLRTGNILYTWVQPDIVLALAISHDGQVIAGAGADQAVSRWYLENRSYIGTFYKYGLPRSHDGIIYSLAISTDGSILASGSADKTIRIWKTDPRLTMSSVLKRTLSGHTDAVLSIAITKDGCTLVSGSNDKTIRIWDTTKLKEPLVLIGHSAPVNSVVIHPNNQLIASGSTDSTIKLWNLKTGENLYTLSAHKGAVKAVLFSNDGKLLVTAGNDGATKFYRVLINNTGHPDLKHLWTIPGNAPIALSPNARTLINIQEKGKIRVWRRCNLG